MSQKKLDFKTKKWGNIKFFQDFKIFKIFQDFSRFSRFFKKLKIKIKPL